MELLSLTDLEVLRVSRLPSQDYPSLGATQEGQEGPEIIVTAKYLPSPTAVSSGSSSSYGFSVVPFYYGVHYGPNTARPDPFGVEYIDVSLSPPDIVSRACEALAEAIELVTNLARPLLPASEERRLDALSLALDSTAIALKTDNIDYATASTQVQSSFAVAFDLLSGAGMSVLFTALGSFATTLTPSPVLKALGMAGFGAAGLAIDWMISDSGAANSLASTLTDALFNGAQALSDKISDIITTVHNGVNFLTHQYMPEHMSFFDVESDGLFGNFDNQAANGSELHVSVYHNGLNDGYLFTTNDVVVAPSGWNIDDGPDPKSPLNGDEPIGGDGAMQRDAVNSVDVSIMYNEMVHQESLFLM